MTNVIIRLRALLRDDDGQDLTEYALLVSLIAIVAMAAIGGLGTSVNNLWNDVIVAGLLEALL